MTPRARPVVAALVVAALGFGASGCGIGGTSGPPEVAARVEGTAIPSTEVERLIEQLPEPAEGEAEGPDLEEARQAALLFLIRMTLLERLGEARGVDAGDREVIEEASRELAPESGFAAAGLTSGDFARGLQAARLSQALAAVVFGDVTVSEVELRTYYDSHPEEFGATWRAVVEVAFLDDSDDVDTLRARVQAGEAYQEVAPTLGPLEMGDLGEVTSASALPPEILGGIAATPVGAVSEPVDLRDGSYAALWVKLREDVGARSFEEARADLADLLVRKRQSRLFNEWFDDQLSEARVEVDPYYGEWDPGLQLVR